jgi:prolyl-tRNA editing enzyme YbaK/EbsC (Cys-tRNA(Pro) deacylase)
MSKAAKARRITKGKKGSITFKVSPKVQHAIDTAKAQGRKVVVVGGVKGGQIQMNPQELAAAAALTKKYPQSTIAFVALNAPFKTRAVTSLR